jgi:hypothetical protein
VVLRCLHEISSLQDDVALTRTPYRVDVSPRYIEKI